MKGATVLNLNEAKQRVGRKRGGRMPAVVQQSVALIKKAEAEMLQRGLDTNDGHQAEVFRSIAVGLNHAAKLVLLAFDAVSRKPSI